MGHKNVYFFFSFLQGPTRKQKHKMCTITRVYWYWYMTIHGNGKYNKKQNKKKTKPNKEGQKWTCSSLCGPVSLKKTFLNAWSSWFQNNRNID